jgi:hypothetical protein
VRLRKNTDATYLYVAECSHINFAVDDYLTVYPYVEPTLRYPFLEDTEALAFYKDWDIAYTDQNLDLYPMALMGAPAVAFLDDSSVNVYFDGSNSYAMAGSLSTYSWVFPSGSPSTSSVQTPGDVAWSATGIYMCSLTVTDSNGKSTCRYCPVWVLPRSGEGAPYTQFEWQNLSGSLSEHGWQANFEVFGDADILEFPEGVMIVLFTEEWYGSTLRAFGGNHEGRHNIRYVGWIGKDTTVKDPETSVVRFETKGPVGVMDQRENFSLALNDVSGTPSEWWELKNMDVRKAIHHLIYWHTTLPFMTDVSISTALTGLLYEQDFARATLVQALEQFIAQSHALWAADRTGCIFVEEDPDLLAAPDDDPGPRNAVPTTMELEHFDWVDHLEIPIEQTPSCSFLYVDGIYYSGGADQDNAIPWISYAPGRAPNYFGRNRQSKGHVMPSTQVAANKLAGLLYAKENNPIPRMPVVLSGNYAVFDLVPVHWVTLSLSASDTRRGVVWSGQRFLPQTVREDLDNENGTIQVNLEVSKEAFGPPGVTGDYPSEEEPEAPYEPPATPVDPVIPGTDQWDGVMIVATDLGLARCDDIRLASPTWEAINAGLSAGANRNIYDINVVRQTDEGVIVAQGGVFITENLTQGTPSWESILTLSEMRTLVGDGAANFHLPVGFGGTGGYGPGDDEGPLVMSWYLDPGYVGVWAKDYANNTKVYYIHTHDYGVSGWTAVDIIPQIPPFSTYGGCCGIQASLYSWNISGRIHIMAYRGNSRDNTWYIYSTDYGHTFVNSGTQVNTGYQGFFREPPLKPDQSWNSNDQFVLSTRWVAGVNAVKKSTTGWGNATWTSIGDSGMGAICYLGCGPHDPDWIVACEDSSAGASEDVWVTKTGGTSWTNAWACGDSFPVKRASRNPWNWPEWVFARTRQSGTPAPFAAIYYTDDYLDSAPSNRTNNLFTVLGNFYRIVGLKSFWGHYEQ